MFADRSYRQTRAAHLPLEMSTGHYSVSLNRFTKLLSQYPATGTFLPKKHHLCEHNAFFFIKNLHN